MLVLTNILCLSMAAATAAAKKGNYEPCEDGVYSFTGAYRSERIHCNTTLAPFEHDGEFFARHRVRKDFEHCAMDCFGVYAGQECCAAKYHPESKKCLLLFAGGSVCAVKGRQFVGPSNDSVNLAVGIDN